MIGYFNNDERIAKLLYHSESWIGTPWAENSEAKGCGVSCHNLPRAVFIACGAMREDFPKMVGGPNMMKHTKISAMEKFIDGRPEFARLGPDDALLPGDMIGLRIGYCLDHLGVVLSDGMFLHVLMHKKTDVDLIRVPPWSQRILAAWRVIE